MSEGITNLRVKEHVVQLKSIPASMRVLTALGLGQVAIGLLMLLFRDVPFPTVIAGKVGGNLVTDEGAPKDSVMKIAPVPLLIVHGTNDEVVPVAQGRQLFAAAAGPKTLFEVKGGHHGDSLTRNDGAYRKKVLAWLAEQLPE